MEEKYWPYYTVTIETVDNHNRYVVRAPDYTSAIERCITERKKSPYSATIKRITCDYVGDSIIVFEGQML